MNITTEDVFFERYNFCFKHKIVKGKIKAL